MMKRTFFMQRQLPVIGKNNFPYKITIRLKPILIESFLILGVAILFVCCKEKRVVEKPSPQNSKESSAYQLEIEKSNCTKNKKDIAVLLFEDGFNGDLIDVYLNGVKIFSKKINTDRTLGYSNLYVQT